MFHKLFAILLCLTVLPIRSAAFDIKSAVDSAFAVDHSLKVGVTRIRSAEDAALGKKGSMQPSLHIGTSYGATNQIEPSKTYHRTQNYSIRITQPIYRPDLWSDYKEANVDVRISNNQYRQKKEELLLWIAQRFIRICQLKSRQQVFRHSLYYTSRSVDIQKKLLKFGYGSKLSLLKAEIELRRYQSELDAIGNSLAEEADAFLQVTDTPINTNEIKTVGSAEIDPVPMLKADRVETSWIEAARSNNLSLRDAMLRKEIGEIKKEQSYNPLIPTIDISLTRQQSLDFAEETSNSLSTTASITLAMSLSPFFTYHNIKASDANYQALYFEEAETRRKIERDIKETLADINRNRESFNAFRKIAIRQEDILMLYRKGFQSKHYSISNVLDAAKENIEIKTSLIQHYFAIWEKAFQLYKIVGQLDRRQMAVLNYFIKYRD